MFGFERRFLTEDDMGEGLLPAKYLNIATVITILLLAPLLYFSNVPFHTGVLVFLSVILGRLFALDLVHLTLPDIYTLPLLITGLIFVPLMTEMSWKFVLLGAGIGFVAPLIFAFVIEKLSNLNSGFGGGDIKLLAAMGAWIGPINLAFAFAFSCFLALLLSFAFPRGKELPFGPALLMSFVIFLCFSKTILALLTG